MVSNRTRGVYLLCVYAHLLITQACFWIWAAAFHRAGIIELFGPDAPAHLLYSEIISIGVVLAATFVRDRNELIGSDSSVANRTAFTQVITAYSLLFLYLAASKDTAISRIFVFSLLPILYLALLWANAHLPALIRRHMFGGEREERILLAGRADNARKLGDWLHRKALVGFQTVGLLCETPDNPPRDQLPLLGTIRDLERVVAKHKVTQLIVVELDLQPNFLSGAAEICERLGIRLLVVSDVDRYFNHAVRLIEDDGVRFFSLRNEPLESPFNRLLKRLLDIVVAAPVALFILPVASVCVGILQRWQSPGPLHFKQIRSGLKNRPFTIYKFRTMHVNNPDETRQATAHDDRIFSLGRWLRKMSIDELPQFYNVLRGDMSVVGPRPHMTQHNDLFAQAMKNYHVRAIAKPGITGLAQVRGFRGEATRLEDITRRVNADVYYLENWSLATDCSIILRTATQMLRPPAKAY